MTIFVRNIVFLAISNQSRVESMVAVMYGYFHYLLSVLLFFDVIRRLCSFKALSLIGCSSITDFIDVIKYLIPKMKEIQRQGTLSKSFLVSISAA